MTLPDSSPSNRTAPESAGTDTNMKQIEHPKIDMETAGGLPIQTPTFNDTTPPNTLSTSPTTETVATPTNTVFPPPHITALTQEAIQHLRAAQGNLEGLADQIAQGEYGPNGAGDAGRIWRTLHNLKEPNQFVDIWGEIMAISTGLWNIGKLEEAIELVDASARSFPVPDIWNKRVHESLKAAKDYHAAREAENAFQDGRDEEALQHAAKISNQSEAEHYKRILKIRMDRRRKQRKAIFSIAAVAMFSLLVASGIAISTVGRLNLAPPTPDFTSFGDTLEQVSNELRRQRDLRDNTKSTTNPDTTTEQNNANAPNDVETQTEADTIQVPTEHGDMPDLDQMLGGGDTQPLNKTTPNTPNPIQTSTDTTTNTTPTLPSNSPPNAFQPIPTNTNTTNTASGTEPPQTQPSPEQPTPANQQRNMAAPQDTTHTQAQRGDLRANCILGYGGLSEAQKLVDSARAGLSQADLNTVETRIRKFSTTLQNACSKVELNASELLRGVAEIEPQQLRAVAESILLGRQ